MSSWSVDYFQLNCSVDSWGDCAIALLVWNAAPPPAPGSGSGPPPPPVKGTVQTTVLIDGGQATEIAKLLQRCITQLEGRYTFPDGHFALDAVVLSHWDVVCLKLIETASRIPFLTSNRIMLGKGHSLYLQNLLTYLGSGFFSFLERTTWNSDGTFPYFRYNRTAKPITPLTRLYCLAQWTVKNFPFSPTPTSQDLIKASNPVPLKKSGADSNAPNCILAYCTTNLLMGHNILANRDPDIDWDELYSLDLLIEKNDPDQFAGKTGAPGLYIVGVNAVVLQPEPELANSGGGFGVINLTSPNPKTNTNPRSIMSLLVWKGAPGAHQIAFYSGGDAEFKSEDLLAGWLADQKYKIESVKAGHHGSINGTSTIFIQSVNPDTYLVSAGTGHSHPSMSRHYSNQIQAC